MTAHTVPHPASSEIGDLLKARGARSGVALADYTTWRVGGAAEWFWEPETVNDVSEMLAACHDAGMPVHYLGRGSNLLVADGGVPGLVVCTLRALQGIEVQGEHLVAEAGAPLPKLSKVAAKGGHDGFAFMIGIPGTVGGGVVINASTGGPDCPDDVRSVLDAVDVFEPGVGVYEVPAEALGLGYRTSTLLDRQPYVLRARFRLEYQASAEAIRDRTKSHLVERKRKQPLTKATAGSTFKAVLGGHAAGWYLDRAGLKGERVGGAVVSEMHANWIVNDGSATADDIEKLMERMEGRVHDAMGVRLEREVRTMPHSVAR